MTCSEWLSYELKKRGMNAGELAERVRMSRAAIHYYTSGERVPSRSIVEKIATALRIDVAEVPEFPSRRELKKA